MKNRLGGGAHNKNKTRTQNTIIEHRVFEQQLHNISLSKVISIRTKRLRNMPPKKRKRESDHSNISHQAFQTSLSKIGIELKPTKVQLSEQDSEQASKTNALNCDAEAIELLRQCHGYFVGIVASQLATGQEGTENKSNETSRHKSSDDNIEVIRSVLPRNVDFALKKLGFDDIDSAKQLCTITKTKIETKANRGEKSKKSFNKNAPSTKELLREQERLLAISAAKMKKSQGLR